MNGFGGLYVHIPFCRKKCRYCDFYSTEDLFLVPDFLDAVKQEMAMRAPRNLAFDTLYFGGGTPSLLSPKHLAVLMDHIFSLFQIHKNHEITLEINPGTVNRSQLAAYARHGINRINIGIQSFQDNHLKCLGRIHTADQGIHAVHLAREAGFNNIGLDLIIGLPGQTREDLEKDLDQLLSFHPEHVSCYMLSYEPGTPLHRMRESGLVHPLPERDVEAFYTFTSEFLESNGYEHYEISNFAKASTSPGVTSYRSRHNVKYWIGAPYMGFGPGAHSFLPPTRLRNSGAVDDYVKSIRARTLPFAETENLTESERFMEEVFLSLRTRDGMVLNTFLTRYNVDIMKTYDRLIAELRQGGYLTVADDRIVLTRKGFLMADGISLKFIQGKK